MSIYSEIQAFIAVVEEQHFTQAGKRLSVTTTAISKQIKQLEARFHQQLFERSTRKVNLTEIGEQFYQHCKRVEHELHLAENYIVSQTTQPQGTLQIISSLWFAELYLQEHLVEFYQCYPKIKLKIELGDFIPKKENFDVLIGFSLMPQIPTELRYRQLFTTRYVLCASPHYLKKYGIPQRPEDLKKHKLLNHTLRVPSNVIRFKSGETIYMSPPDIIINSLDFLTTLCCKGLGIFQTTLVNVKDLLDQGKLVEILPLYSLGEPNVYLFYRYTEYEQIKVKCFINFIDKKINNRAY